MIPGSKYLLSPTSFYPLNIKERLHILTGRTADGKKYG